MFHPRNRASASGASYQLFPYGRTDAATSGKWLSSPAALDSVKRSLPFDELGLVRPRGFLSSRQYTRHLSTASELNNLSNQYESVRIWRGRLPIRRRLRDDYDMSFAFVERHLKSGLVQSLYDQLCPPCLSGLPSL